MHATMDPLEFLMMSPLFQNDEDSCSVFLLFFIIISVSEVIHKTIHREWWKFPRLSHMWKVIHKDVWNFDSEVRGGLWIQEYRITYTYFLSLVEFLRPYIAHETTNYRATIEVDRAIAISIWIFQWTRCQQLLCWTKCGLEINFYCYKGFG